MTMLAGWVSLLSCLAVAVLATSPGLVSPACSCSQVFLSSQAELAATQPAALGIYTATRQRIANNSRPIYTRHTTGQVRSHSRSQLSLRLVAVLTTVPRTTSCTTPARTAGWWPRSCWAPPCTWPAGARRPVRWGSPGPGTRTCRPGTPPSPSIATAMQCGWSVVITCRCWPAQQRKY